MWRNSHKDDVYRGLAPPEENGWICHEENGTAIWAIDWDCPQLQSKVQETINFLTKGCSCKKGKCEGMRCGCHKNRNTCGPGCNCQGCVNLSVTDDKVAQIEDSDSDDTEDEESGDEPNDAYKSEDEYTEEVVTEDFTCLLVDLPDV